MVFGKPNKNIPIIELHINTANIDKVQNFNFLGLHVSSDITSNLHIDEVSKKISRVTGILKKLRLIVPKSILLTIYNTLISPHINYGLLIWGNKSGKILQLQKKQFEQSPVQDTFLIQNHFLVFFFLFFAKKLPIVDVRDVCPSVRLSVRLSDRPSVCLSVCGNNFFSRQLDI